MANMAYCRFENTYNDLQDCNEHLDDKDLSDIEKKFRNRLFGLCKDIATNEFDLQEQD